MYSDDISFTVTSAARLLTDEHARHQISVNAHIHVESEMVTGGNVYCRTCKRFLTFEEAVVGARLTPA